MFNKSQVVKHIFKGGWSYDFGPSVDVTADNSGQIGIPFLVNAINCLFGLDGGPYKIGGTSKVNSSAVASGATVMGVFDYWKQGVVGNPSRRRILHAGTVCLADNDDGNYTSTLASGLEAGKIPSYCTFDDLLIISSDSTVDVPRSWDQTTAQNLAGSPPNFAFCVAHKNRAWAAGVSSSPSRLYYSNNTDPEDWIGSGAGHIDIDPNDGDVITGLVSHQGDLWVFKGPNKGSINRITGSAPTGSDGFGRVPFITGLGAAWHNSIFRFADDIGFVSQYGSIHSLSATAAYGDFYEASLSRPINTWIKEHLNYNKLKQIWSAVDPLLGVVYITMAIDANSTNNVVLAMDFRDAPDVIRWSKISAYSMASLGLFVDTNGLRRIIGGGNDGYVRRLNVSDRSIDGITAIAYQATTPYLNYGNTIQLKTIGQASVGIEPKGNFTGTFGWTRDNNSQQTYVFNQSGSDVLAPAPSHQFTLDTSRLSGSQFIDVYMELEEGGDFRSIQYDVTQNGLGENISLHSFTTIITPSGISTENG